MKMQLALLPLALFGLGCTQPIIAQTSPRPTIYLIGDSTVKNNTAGQQGWGSLLDSHFDTSRISIENRALGGRSSRSYLREGLWARVLEELQPGDFVIIQFGHNDNGPFDEGRARASIKSNGEESRTITIKETGVQEVVYSYGHYLRGYVNDTKAKGATPVVCSLIPRNMWENGKVLRATEDYTRWAREAALESGAAFLDLNRLIADRYEALGEAEVQKLFTPVDHTHTSPAGARFNAQAVADGLRALPLPMLHGFMNAPASPTNTEKIVALTFDDACLSQATFAAPLLKKYGFGATFYVCEFPDFHEPGKYMTWDQIAGLHAMGFEIGSHTLTHKHVDKMKPGELEEELAALEKRCADHGIPRPTTFAYPAYVENAAARKVLAAQGYILARIGGNRVYDPTQDDPLLIPSYSTTGQDERSAARVLEAIEQAAPGKVVVLTIHGLPDTAHPHVTTAPELFERYLKYLHEHQYKVVALRDLAVYLPPVAKP